MAKKSFLTFADSRMWRSLRRISRQAGDMGVYDRIIAADENLLDSSFLNKFKDGLIPCSRGVATDAGNRKLFCKRFLP